MTLLNYIFRSLGIEIYFWMSFFDMHQKLLDMMRVRHARGPMSVSTGIEDSIGNALNAPSTEKCVAWSPTLRKYMELEIADDRMTGIEDCVLAWQIGLGIRIRKNRYQQAHQEKVSNICTSYQSNTHRQAVDDIPNRESFHDAFRATTFIWRKCYLIGILLMSQPEHL